METSLVIYPSGLLWLELKTKLQRKPLTVITSVWVNLITISRWLLFLTQITTSFTFVCLLHEYKAMKRIASLFTEFYWLFVSTVATKGPLRTTLCDRALSIHLTRAASTTGAFLVRIQPRLFLVVWARGSLRNTRFRCCISLARVWQSRENDFLFPAMISVCTSQQPQVTSWKQTGYGEAKYHGSKVTKKNNNTNITVALNSFSTCCHVWKDPKWTL